MGTIIDLSVGGISRRFEWSKNSTVTAHGALFQNSIKRMDRPFA